MRSLQNAKVVTQLLLGFSAVMILLVLVGAIGLFEVKTENQHVADLRDDQLPSVQAGLQMLAGLRAIRIGEWGAVASTSADGDSNSDQIIGAAIADYDKTAATYETLITAPAQKAAFERLSTMTPQYYAFDQKVRDLAKQRNTAEATELLHGPANALRKSMEKEVLAMVDADIARAADEGHAAQQAFEHAIELILALVMVAILVAVSVALVIARGLSRQLGGEPRDAARLAEAIAAGDVSIAVRLRAGDRSSLMYSLGVMKDQLHAIVRGIKTSSASISDSAGEIAQGNTDLSQRTEEQAASLEETASSMEQLTATVRQNADNARQATTLSGAASQVAQRGGEVIGRVVDTMHGISESSAKVSEIIAVVEGIAFQTNILALNAAVEAARAGEQGRGFAVVAAEVRTLAQRSANAAKEIKALIDEALQRVGTGSSLVGEAGSTINEIVQSVRRVSDIMSEISAASEEQSSGIEQVNRAVTQMDQMTQQNAALVEQATAAAHSMAQQARDLLGAVDVFKLEGSAHSAY
ncbi:MAG TPA: methyl-accepting chemotaxis protein [Paraburkholderia sp.]|jgi:methyl-accepting chemotaxis protein